MAPRPPQRPHLLPRAREQRQPAEREPEHVRAGVTHEECGGTARPVVEGQKAEASACESGGDDGRARPGTRPPTKARPIAAIAAVPAARPSMWSRRLKLFMLATRISTRSGCPPRRVANPGGDRRWRRRARSICQRASCLRRSTSRRPTVRARKRRRRQHEREVAPIHGAGGERRNQHRRERAEDRDAARDGRHRTDASDQEAGPLPPRQPADGRR